MLLNAYEEYIDNENNEHAVKQKEYEEQMQQTQHSQQKQQQLNYGGFKIPNVNMPKLNIPNFKT